MAIFSGCNTEESLQKYLSAEMKYTFRIRLHKKPDKQLIAYLSTYTVITQQQTTEANYQKCPQQGHLTTAWKEKSVLSLNAKSISVLSHHKQSTQVAFPKHVLGKTAAHAASGRNYICTQAPTRYNNRSIVR